MNGGAFPRLHNAVRSLLAGFEASKLSDSSGLPNREWLALHFREPICPHSQKSSRVIVVMVAPMMLSR